jgi:hypothetical protein
MYAQVRNNEVVARVNELPRNFNNISNFFALPNAELKMYGWYPVIQDIPEYNPDTERLQHNGYTIGADSVIEHFVKEPKPAPPPQTRFSRLAFRSRFTLQELVTIEAARLSNPSITVRATLQVLTDNLMAAELVDITDERTILGVETLVSMGLLTQDRANEILGR